MSRRGNEKKQQKIKKQKINHARVRKGVASLIREEKMKKYLMNLKNDIKGSALPIMAAAIVPILIVIGGGLDYARAGLAQAKLQEAVDSAALAGRRTMSQEQLSSATPNAQAFLNHNFAEGSYGTGDLTVAVTKPDVGVIRVTAETTLDTTLLKIIGINQIPVTAQSEATQNFDNVDIMLVLDTTGSMNQSLNGKKRIASLREAVINFHRELKPAQDQLKAQGLRLRIGIVPYSGSVNVGKILYKKNSSYIQTNNVPYYHWHRNVAKNGNVSWNFGKRTYNLTNYVNGGQLGNIGNHGNNQSARWDGCVEERKTVNNITANDSRRTPPTDAHDLDIDLIPNSNKDTKWKPYVFDPLNGNPNEYCPNEARPLAEITESEITKYVNDLVAQGSTYHDVGMIWGTRMISNGGVFGSNNPSSFNGRPVNKHIIFMTDGIMSAPVVICPSTNWWGQCANSTANYSPAYSGYGIEAFDRRIGASNTNDNNGRHTRRFLMLCNAAKERGVNVWTIAFGTGSVDSLDNCASNSDQAFTISNSTGLVEKFAEIGRNIGALRLSK